MQLLADYKSYYSNPSFDTIDRLWSSITEWNGDNIDGFCQEIVPLWEQAKVNKEESSFVVSNGSTRNVSSFHLFGPYHSHWYKLTDQWAPGGNPVLYLFGAFPRNYVFRQSSTSTDYLWTLRKTHFPHVFNMPIDILHPRCYEIVFKAVDLLSSTFEAPVAIQSYQSILMRMFHDVEFISMLESHASKVVRFDNVFWDPLFDSGRVDGLAWVNDRMIDWSKGTRFYTCQEGGNKHFLPTFVVAENGIVDLLNLSDKGLKTHEDLIEIDMSSKCKCACGKYYYQHKFIPHIDFSIRDPANDPVYDMSIAKGLKSRFSSLQFIQNERDVVEACYIIDNGRKRIEEHDRNRISSFFESYQLHTKFSMDKYLLLGRRYKLVSFWKNLLDLNISEYESYVPDHWNKPMRIIEPSMPLFTNSKYHRSLVAVDFESL